MRLIDADVFLNLTDEHSYPVYHGVGFSDVDYGMTLDGIKHCVKETPTISEWISVKDKLPEKPGFYLIYIPSYSFQSYSYYMEVCYYSLYEGWQHGYGDQAELITHWMALPEPPEESEDENNA